ncbi:MAG TPA: OmpH family outer membrane protein, partial [Gemmatimonadaceae bacterium]|nr:OmpH family outer membrane protein [Gemmatimonadaceae bacterium]
MNAFTRASLAAALAACAAGVLAAQSPLKLAYVNSQKILPQAPGFADAQATMETEAEGVKAQEQRMMDSLNFLIGEYQKAQPTLTPAQRTQRENALRAKQQEFQQRAAQLEQRAQQRQAELVEPIREQIRGIIEGLRVDGGYAMIFDIGAQGGGLVAVDTSLDLSDKVIAKLQAAGPPKPAAKPAAKP